MGEQIEIDNTLSRIQERERIIIYFIKLFTWGRVHKAVKVQYL